MYSSVVIKVKFDTTREWQITDIPYEGKCISRNFLLVCLSRRKINQLTYKYNCQIFFQKNWGGKGVVLNLIAEPPILEDANNNSKGWFVTSVSRVLNFSKATQYKIINQICMPLEAPVTRAPWQDRWCSSSLLGSKILKNGWFRKESPNITTFTPNSLLTSSYYYISSSSKCYRF